MIGLGHRRRRPLRRELRLPGRPESVAEARALVLALDGPTPEQAYNAALCLSELMANAILHTRSGLDGGSVLIILEPVGSLLRVEVRDAGPVRRHAPEAADGLPESGRGLLIVAAVSCACDVRHNRSAWAEVAA